MKKLIRIVGVLAVVMVAVILVLLAAAKVLVTPERVRQVVIPAAQERLNRPVSIGDIRVRIFSGIEISDFVIGSRKDSENFVSADTLVLRYRFWPLLRLSVIVDEARLESPEIRGERYENGKFNFSDLLADDTSGEKTAEEDAGVQGEEKGGRTIDLLVNRISVSGGRLVFTDRMVNREYRLEDLSVSVTGFSPDRSFPFDISGKINGSPFDLTGTANPETMQAASQMQVKGLDVAAYMPYAAADFPGKLSRMKLDLDIKADINGQRIDSSGKIILSNIDLQLDDLSDVPIENARAALEYNLGIDTASEKIAIEKADADLNGILLSVSGDVLSYGTAPVLDMALRMPMSSLSDIMSAIPQKLIVPVAELQPKGKVGARLHLKGSLEKPEQLVETGEIVLDKTGVTVNELKPEISGDIHIANDTVFSDNLVMAIAGDMFQVNFTANSLMGDVIEIDSSIRADRFNIDRFLEAVESPDEKPVPPPERPPDKPEEPGPFDLPVRAQGDVRVANAVYRGLTVTDFTLQYQIRDNVLTINQIDGNVAGGTLSGSAGARLDRRPIAYSADISVSGTRAENILNSIFPAASNTVFGTMFLNADIKGKGTGWDVVKQHLTFRGDVNITDGKLTGSGIAGGLASFLDSGSLEVLEFDSMKGNVKMEDGKIKLDSQFTGDRVRMAPVGDIGLDGTLDLSLNLRLSPDMASQIQIGKIYSQLARTQDGWIMMPVDVQGALWSPKFKPDTSAVSEQLREKGEQELRKQFRDKVLDRLAPQDTDTTQEQEDKGEKAPLEKKLEDTLKNLFN